MYSCRRLIEILASTSATGEKRSKACFGSLRLTKLCYARVSATLAHGVAAPMTSTGMNVSGKRSRLK